MKLGDRNRNGCVDDVYRPNLEQTVNFAFEGESLYLFDPSTGESLQTKTGGIETGVAEYILTEPCT